jgi:hypothetical protein
MRERIAVQRKKVASTFFSIPTLKQPRRGFGLESSEALPQGDTQVKPLDKALGHDISRISLRPQAKLQTKLTVNQPGDIYEQEADTVAQQVMRTINQPNQQSIQREELPEEELQMKSLDTSIQRQQLPEEEEELQMKSLGTSIQRQQLPEEEEELQMKSLGTSIQRQQLPEEEEELQMKSMVQRQPNNQEKTATPDLETSIQQARGSGQMMANSTRKPMEQAFGADFSGVRIHNDAQSDQLNQSIQARAFTTGQDIFFRQGEYNPGNSTGQELLAHELTHVVQQNGSATKH